MSTGQVKRKQNPGLDNAHVQNDAAAPPTTTKKQRDNSTTTTTTTNTSSSTTTKPKVHQPQFLDFSNDDNTVLLPRGPVATEESTVPTKSSKKSTTTSNRLANEDDLFSSKKTQAVKMTDDDDGSIKDIIVDQIKKSKHDFTASQVKQRKIGQDSIETPVRISLKELAIGEILFATVTHITPFELKVALPDGLVGRISYREITDTLTSQIDACLETKLSDPAQVDIESLDNNLDLFRDIPSLSELFTIGQQLTPMVINIVQSQTKKQKILCSLRPSVINAQYSQSLSLLPSCGVPLIGDIESIEEKGYVINYGLSFKGFVPFTNKITPETYIKGALVTTLLPRQRTITKSDRSIQVTLDTDKITHYAISMTTDLSFEQIRPGQFFRGVVSKHLKDGLVVQILGSFSVTITRTQLPPCSQPTKDFPLLHPCIVRILSCRDTLHGKKIAATMRYDLTQPRSLYGSNLNFASIAQLGDLKQATVLRSIHGNKALLVKFHHDGLGAVLPNDYYAYKASKSTKDDDDDDDVSKKTTPILGFLSLPQCADVPLTDFPKQFKVGATITTRVTGFNHLDGVIQLTTKPSLLQAQAMTYEQIVGGEKYYGIVIATLATDKEQNDKNKKDGKKEQLPQRTIDNGIILQISPTITAFIPISQLSNRSASTNPALLAKRYAIGSQHECRILVSEPSKRKLIATLKPAMVERYGQDEVFTSYQHAKEVISAYKSLKKPLLLGGYVDNCTEEIVVVRFYNNIVGIVTKAMLVEQGIITADQSPQYDIGQYILTRVIGLTPDKQKLSLSLHIGSTNDDEQQDGTKLTAKEIAQAQKKSFYDTEPCVIGAVIPNVQITGSTTDYITLSFSISDRSYQAQLPKGQLSDIESNQFALFTKLTTKIAGTDLYPTLSAAIVTGYNKDTNIAQLSIKFSTFFMQYQQLDTMVPADIVSLLTPPKKVTNPIELLNTTLTKFATKFATVKTNKKKDEQVAEQRLTVLPQVTMATAKNQQLFVGTITSIEEQGLRLYNHSFFVAFVHKRHLTDESYTNIENVDLSTIYKVGQSVLFTEVPSKEVSPRKYYQLKTQPIIKHYPTQFQFWEQYYRAAAEFESTILAIPNPLITINNTIASKYVLGQTISNAKVSAYSTDHVQFTTSDSIKSKIIIKCTNVEYHAPTITSTTIGSTMDVTIIGIENKTIYVTTLDRFKSKIAKQTAQVTFPTSIIGTTIPATVISTSSTTPTISIPQFDNNLLSLLPPNSFVNLIPYQYYSNILHLDATITIYPISTTQAIYMPYVPKTKQPKADRVFAAGTFYDESIQTQTDIKPDATFAVKLLGLMRGATLVQPEDYAQLNDLSRCFIAAEFGASGENGIKSIAERFVAQISLSSLVDPTVPTITKGKKSSKSTPPPPTTTNVLEQLKTLLTTQNKKGAYSTTKAKIISQKTSSKTILVPTFVKKPLHQIISYLSIRPTDLESDDYQHRFQTENYKQGSVHNAVVLSFDDVTGIIAQVTPFLQVIIRPTACGVREIKKGKYESIPFDELKESIKIGDFITFKLQTDPVDQNNLTLLHGALIHNEFNPQGKDISTDEYTITAPSLIASSTPSPSSTTTETPKQIKPKAERVDLAIGQIVTGATIVQYNEKSATYFVNCQGNRGEINLAEIVDYSELDDNLASFNPTTYYSPGDILPKVIVLSSKMTDQDKPPIYILSARLSRQDLILPDDIQTDPEITQRSQAVCKSLEQWAIDHKSTIINTNKPTITKGKKGKTTTTTTDDIVQVEPSFDDITQDVLVASHFVPNQFVLGYITAITKAGVFVQLSGLVNGLIKFSDLVDIYSDFQTIKSSSLYQIGQPLICRVRDINTNGQVNLIAKPSVANLNDARIFASLVPGTVVSGIVKRVTDNGVFVTLKHSQSLDGLAYKTECVDDKTVSFQNYYKPGDKVKAVVLRVNPTDRKISLGLKASLFTKLDKIKAQGGRTHEDGAKDKSVKGSLGMKKDTMNDDSSDDEFETTRQKRMGLAVDSSSDDDSDDDDEQGTSKPKPINNIILQQQQKLNSTAEKEQKIISTLFTATLPQKSTKKQKATMNDDDEEELIDFGVDSELTTRLNNNTIGTKHTNTKDSSERKIELLEHALVGLGDQSIMSTINTTGELTIDQYEIQCASQPNNASVWISYMAYQLENNEIQKARDVVTKALKIMTVSALDQRWLIFSSLLSIEILFGTPTSLEQAVTKTAKEFDKIKVYSEVGRIAISSNKYPLAIDFYTKALRSSGLAQDKVTNQTKPRSILQQVQDIYIALISLQFAQSKRTESQQLLKQAIQQLPTQYSSYISVKTILLEYQSQHGSLSTGRTMFQMFLKDNVKRIDVWTTWIQQEIKVCKKLHQFMTQNSNTVTQAKKNEFKQQKTRVRELFDIFTTKAPNTYNITWSTFKPAQIQPIYALAIEFENSPPCLGDSRTDIIKDRAKIYVDEVSKM